MKRSGEHPRSGAAAEQSDDARIAPLWLSALGLACVWVAVGTFFALQVIVIENLPISFAVRMAAMDWGPWIVASPLVLWLSRRFPIRAGTWKAALAVHLVASVVLATAFEFALFASRRDPGPRMGPRPEQSMFFPAPREPMLMQGPPGNCPSLRMIHARFHLPIYWLLVAAAHAIAFHRRSLERERRALLAEARLAEARLAALQAQINPHFLFNTLNAIAQYVHEDPDIAERMIESLSSLLRLILAASEKREVPLREELVFIDHYLSIQLHRFADRLTVAKQIDEQALDTPIPTLILQPLVENAIIHGIARSRGPGQLWIRISKRSSRIRIEITDSGDGTAKELPEGTQIQVKERLGVANTRARLEAFRGAGGSLSFTLAKEGGLSAIIEYDCQPA